MLKIYKVVDIYKLLFIESQFFCNYMQDIYLNLMLFTDICCLLNSICLDIKKYYVVIF